jgi:Fe-S cluster assembly protein SufD
MSAIALPTRRDEAWKWSDLRAAWGQAPLPAAIPERAGHPVIVQLAAAAGEVAHVALSEGESGLRVERMEEQGFDARAVQIDLAPGAAFTRLVLQEGPAVSLNMARVRVGAGATYRQFVLAFGSKLARVETHVETTAEGAAVELNAVYLAGPARHIDLTSEVRHLVGGGVTRQLVKGAARAGGRGVFQGKFFVAREAQKTDAQQHHHALLLEEGAEVYAKPELEIYADDVACAHGNTAGALDEAALFYMRARGIPEGQARALLVEAFLNEAIPDDLPEHLLAEIRARVASWLGGGDAL